MKKQHYIFIGIAVAVVLVVAWWVEAGSQKAPIKNPTETKAENPAQQPTPAPQITATATTTGGVSASATPKKIIDQVVSKAELMKEEWAGENGKSMDTYGKVIDQYGTAIAGVKVEEGVGLYVDFTHSGGNKYYTETDSNGKFSFTGIHGAWSGYDFKKPGYEYNLRLPTSTRPKNYIPDPDQPIIFTMWKIKGAEPMTFARINKQIPSDGSATSFNLLTGKPVTEGGDLVIKLTRNPVDFVPGKPHDWSLVLEMSGGGLVETSDPYLYEAPADGYKSSITYTMPADMPNWSSGLARIFYFKSRDGKVYGDMSVSISTGGGPRPLPTFIDALIYANPAGSRNLEYDSSQRITSP